MIEIILTEKNALERVKQNGRALQLVPEELKTQIKYDLEDEADIKLLDRYC